ncbi:MAG: methyltransferase [Candidatus Magasanikbacteria bacterium]|nr:methyltransferase [Candidatus Magasanikbacteria bacterium]
MAPVRIEKLIYGGQALARDNGKTIFLWNALPGELVEYEILKKRKGIVEARAAKILEPSAVRIEPREAHYLSCSPWEIMTREAEDKWKQEIALETYQRIGKLDIAEPDLEIISAGPDYGYRNKIEFSFWTEPSDNSPASSAGKLSLAFFNRGTHRLISLPAGCALAHPEINKTAEIIRAWLESEGVHGRIAKSLIVRSNEQGETIAAVFLKGEINFTSYPLLKGLFKGLQIYYSSALSPASTPDKLLYTAGQNYLIANIGEKQFKFGALSFFQINGPVFYEALKDIKKFVLGSKKIVDFYSGVGAIGLSLGEKSAIKNSKLTLVEINSEASRYAKENAVLNGSWAEVVLAPSENALDYITRDVTIVVDPPRAGLHPKFVDKILEVGPEQLIYLSCDIATQARDLQILSVKYKIIFQKLYNFFPRTPHIEALAVLEQN